ncbi:fungal-specific transcription factor domain-containing protein [Fusarium tricinctum]|uniref:Fungal-specific transcription factor domain-containing protein n=1 Tax=Fusarium tricinctum TaxID=61284 RepID=A0A8K0S9V5_9HYPO|nr:fungal-specific transcription factor domain-containing protein [Fusarium tricinctum]
MEDNNSHTGQYRSACAECHRRKQKCNREWPCNHCQKRKVADKCRFIQGNTASSPSDSLTPGSEKKRSRSREDDGEPESSEPDEEDDDVGLGAMGYAAGPLFESLTIDPKKDKKPLGELTWVHPRTCPQLKHAIDVLPGRPQMDALVQSFFNNMNYHYYIIYPPVFLQEYQEWWDRRSRNQSLSLQWTILLVMVCACATQHLDVDMKPIIEVQLSEPSDKLTVEYHKAATELGRVIPLGHCHLLNIQWMLHSIYWYKSEAKFVEAWHVIGAAVREAHELGLHRTAIAEGLSEFEREMRRRVWCVLDCWDWQFASGLGRPTIIDHSDINVEPPSLALEDFSPSPLLHMKLQSELVTQLAQRWGAPKNITSANDIQEYKATLEQWIGRFPAVYDVDNPDTSKDMKYSWIVYHRFYLHTMAYLMILNPMRSFMAQVYTKNSSEEVLAVRNDAVKYSLKNLDTTNRWANHASHRDGRFHFIIFSLFDTAAVLSTAVIKDHDDTIPRKDEIIDSVDNSIKLLKRLKLLSKTAKTSYDILVKMAQKMPRKSPPQREIVSRKKQRVAQAPIAEPVSNHNQEVYYKKESQESSPSYYGSSEGAGAESTPPSNYSHDAHDHAAYVPTAQVPQEGYAKPQMSYNVGAAPHQVPSPSAGIDGIVQSGGLYSMNQMDHQVAGMLPQQYVDYQPQDLNVDYGMGIITDIDLGDFSQLWDWRSLNLDFIHSSS